MMDSLLIPVLSIPQEKPYTLSVFHNLRVVLVGFSTEDREIMERLLQQNNGTVVDIKDIRDRERAVTHVVRVRAIAGLNLLAVYSVPDFFYSYVHQ